MAVDPAELLLRLDHARCTPAQRHLAVAPALHVGGVVPADLDHRLDGVGGAKRSGERGRNTEAADGEGLGEALTQRGGRTGVRALQLLCQRLQVALAGKRIGVAIGGAHAALDDRGHVLGQVAPDVADLVLFAPSDHRVVEDGLDRRWERGGPVDDEQRRLGHVQAPVTQPHEEALHDRRVLGVALHEGEGVLGPVDVDAERNHAQMLGKRDPVDHDRHQVELGEVGRHELGERRLGHGHEPARHRRLGHRAGLGRDRRAHGLEADLVAARRELRHHPGQRLSPEQLGRRRQLVGRQVHLGGVVCGAQSGPADRHPATPEGDHPVVAPMAHGGPVRIVAALGARQRRGLGLQDGVDHLHPRTHREGEQALLELAGEIGDGHGDGVRQCDGRLMGVAHGVGPRLLRRGAPGAGAAGRGLVVLVHGGPLPELDVLRTPDTYHQAGIRRGTATSRIHAQRDNLPTAARLAFWCRHRSVMLECAGDHDGVLTLPDDTCRDRPKPKGHWGEWVVVEDREFR